MAVSRKAVRLALRLRAKPALPADRFYANIAFTEPAPTVPFTVESLVQGTSQLLSMPAQGGTRKDTGLYIVNWYGVQNDGPDAMDDSLSALLARFAPGLAMTAADGSIVRIREDTAPYAGEIKNLDTGRPVATVTIPWWLQTTNSL